MRLFSFENPKSQLLDFDSDKVLPRTSGAIQPAWEPKASADVWELAGVDNYFKEHSVLCIQQQGIFLFVRMVDLLRYH